MKAHSVMASTPLQQAAGSAVDAGPWPAGLKETSVDMESLTPDAG